MALRKNETANNADETVVEGTVLDAPSPQQDEPTTEITIPAATKVAVAVDNSHVMKELETEGFEGLDLDFSSFTGIVLNGGNFENSSTKQPLRSREFTCRVTRTRPKWAWKSSHPNDKDKQVVYSYDHDDAANPESRVAKAIAEWKAEGFDIGEVKKYLEVWALMESCPEDQDLEGCLISMSIPPTSIGRLSGYLATLHMKGRHMADVLTKVTTGAKVTSVDFPYTPWSFSEVR